MKKNILLLAGIVSGLSILVILPFKFIELGKIKNTDTATKNTPLALAPKKIISPDQTFLSQDQTALSDKNTYGSLPVAQVTDYKVADAWGTVVYIPQTHRNPGSDPADASNDSAEIAQQQMYKIISFLNDKYGINFVMAEGDLYGQVPGDKLGYLSKKVAARNIFTSQMNEIKEELKNENASSQIQNEFADSADKYISSLDREIILQGAPYKLKAEGKNLTLYGSENKATQDESTVIVRNYIYQQDRQQQLAGGGNSSSQIAQNSGTTSLSDAYSLLMSLHGESNDALESDLNSLKTISQNNGHVRLADLVKAGIETYQSIKNLQNQNVASASSIPSRQDNPYATVNDQKKIDSLIKESESQIQSIVIDRRNQETAINLANALKAENQKVGIIQFGAGHEEGLVKELNKQGLNVIVITADEVVNRSTPQTSSDTNNNSKNNSSSDLNISSIQNLLKMIKK